MEAAAAAADDDDDDDGDDDDDDDDDDDEMMTTMMHLSKSLCNHNKRVHQFLPMACKDLPSPEVHQRR